MVQRIRRFWGSQGIRAPRIREPKCLHICRERSQLPRLDALHYLDVQSRVALGCAGLVLAAVLSGCAGTVSMTNDGSKLFSASGPQPGDEAGIEGTVALTATGCVGLTGTDGMTRLVIWPQGTSLSSADTLEAPGLASIHR